MKKFFFVAALIVATGTEVSAQRTYEYNNDRRSYDSRRDDRRRDDSRDNDRRKDDYDWHDDERRYGRDYNRYDNNRRDRWKNDYAPDHWEQIANRKISDGERRGLITRWEAKRLYRELDRIDRRESAFRRNGSFSRREHAIIANEIEDLFHEIKDQMHDDDVVYGYWRGRF